ncbi:MAG: hypothetical protein AB7P03_26680 [Kofleriaceae bacterium]
MSDPSAATELPPGRSAPSERPKYKRKLSNYLLDKKLQLRYVLFVTILSGAIAGALGYLIFQQMRKASESIEQDLQVLAESSDDSLQHAVSSNLEAGDHQLVFMMVGIGLGLVMILSAYLVLMTHKVAGPLYKVSMYFDKMAVGKLGRVTPLRSGDMLTDFYANFQEMHEAVRARALADAELMERVATDLRTAQTQADYRGEARSKLIEALDGLDKHVADRKNQLA